MSWKYPHSDEFVGLVCEYPLVPITSHAQHERALIALKKLAVSKKLTRAEHDYFRVLSGLIRDYESSVIEPVFVSPQEALRFLMEQNSLSQAELSQIVSMRPSHLSEFLSGKPRKFPKRAAAILSARFNVDPALFLPPLTANEPES